MPSVRFAYQDPRATGTDAPATGQLFLALAQPEPVGGALRSTRPFTVPLVDGAATVPLSAGYWFVTTEGVEGENERWIIVPDVAGPLDAVDLENIDPVSLEPAPLTPPLRQTIDARIAAYMADHPGASPEQIGEVVAEYLAENPPSGGTIVTLTPHPTFPGAAILNVVAPGTNAPTITDQPDATSVATGAAASFTAQATGEPTPTVLWQRNDGSGWVTIGAPEIGAQPVAANVAAGASATFTASASGDPAPTVQWQKNDGSGWSNIMGAISTTHTVANAQPDDSGTQYRAVFSNAAGSATSNPATLTVTGGGGGTAPTVGALSSAGSQYGNTGSVVTLALPAITGDPAPTITVQALPVGATTGTFVDMVTSLPSGGAVQAEVGYPNAGQQRVFRLKVANGAGTVFSNEVTLTASDDF